MIVTPPVQAEVDRHVMSYMDHARGVASIGTTAEDLTMPTETQSATRAELLSRREDILARLGVSLSDLEERRDAADLSPDEWEAWEELDGIRYLLG